MMTAPPRGEESGRDSLRTRSPILAGVLGAASISSSSIVVDLAHRPAGTTAFFRCLFALPFLAAVSAVEGRRLGGRGTIGRRLGSLVGGAFLGVDLVLWTHTIYDVGAGVATVLGNLQVIFVAFIAWLAFKERLRARFLVALPVVLFGVVLVAGLFGHATTGSRPVAGVLYGLGTSVTYAAFILLLRRTTQGVPHVAGPLLDATLGAAFSSLLLGLVLNEMSFSLSGPSFGWLLLLAVLSQTLGWLFITSALPRLPAAVSSLLLLLQPAAALLIAYLVLSERPTPAQVFGAVLVCVGVLAAARAKTDAAPEPTPG